jgi:hypothetical protein
MTVGRPVGSSESLDRGRLLYRLRATTALANRAQQPLAGFNSIVADINASIRRENDDPIQRVEYRVAQ